MNRAERRRMLKQQFPSQQSNGSLSDISHVPEDLSDTYIGQLNNRLKQLRGEEAELSDRLEELQKAILREEGALNSTINLKNSGIKFVLSKPDAPQVAPDTKEQINAE